MIEQGIFNKLTGKCRTVGILQDVHMNFNPLKYELKTDFVGILEGENNLKGKKLCEIFRESIRPKYTLLQQVQFMKAASYLWDLIEVKEELTVDDYNEFREVLTTEVSSLTFVNMTELNELLDYIYLSNGFLGE